MKAKYERPLAIKQSMIYRSALVDIINNANFIIKILILPTIRKLNNELNNELIRLAEKDKLNSSLFD